VRITEFITHLEDILDDYGDLDVLVMGEWPDEKRDPVAMLMMDEGEKFWVSL